MHLSPFLQTPVMKNGHGAASSLSAPIHSFSSSLGLGCGLAVTFGCFGGGIGVEGVGS